MTSLLYTSHNIMIIQHNDAYGSFHAKSTHKMDDPSQISIKLGLQVVPHDLLAHSKF